MYDIKGLIMERYRSYCPYCDRQYSWVGYKTGLGKTEAQLERMKNDQIICKYCKKPVLQTVLDYGYTVKPTRPKPEGQNFVYEISCRGCMLSFFRYVLGDMCDKCSKKVTEDDILCKITIENDEVIKKEWKSELVESGEIERLKQEREGKEQGTESKKEANFADTSQDVKTASVPCFGKLKKGCILEGDCCYSLYEECVEVHFKNKED